MQIAKPQIGRNAEIRQPEAHFRGFEQGLGPNREALTQR
jgi:hypothetical protein